MTNTQTQTSTAGLATLQSVVDGYFACWNATDADARTAALARTWTEDATYSDPMSQVTGPEQLAGMIAGVQESYPGHTFRQVGALDAHHSLLRWGFEVIDPDGTKVLDGIDVAIVTDDGRLANLAGFFGTDLPSEPTRA